MAKPLTEPCPCGSRSAYTDCCGALHCGQLATTAEQLMRSRYSAFVLGDENYLRTSWHPSTLPTDLSLDADSQRRWLGLTVIAHDQSDGDHATVEFVARSRAGGQPAQRHHEVSRFVREQGRWLYLDGDVNS
jgi:SEC-C motif-containing protein